MFSFAELTDVYIDMKKIGNKKKLRNEIIFSFRVLPFYFRKWQ